MGFELCASASRLGHHHEAMQELQNGIILKASSCKRLAGAFAIIRALCGKAYGRYLARGNWWTCRLCIRRLAL